MNDQRRFRYLRGGSFALVLACTFLACLVPGALASDLPISAGGVVVSLLSERDGQVVSPSELVSWEIAVRVSPEQNLGLALISVDLVQDPANPVAIQLTPGERGSDALLSFDRPLGFANPGEDPWGSTFGGTKQGTGLIQIGGAQNTFGVAPQCVGPDEDVCMGQNVEVVTGVGQGEDGVIVARGIVVVPDTPGIYRIRVSKVLANLLARTNIAPWPSLAVQVDRIFTDGGEISFTVE